MAQRLLIDNRDGAGLRDYSQCLHEAGQFTQKRRNEPTLFDFQVVPVEGVPWVPVARGAYVRLEDDRWENPGLQDNSLFTGYVTDEPDPVFLGTRDHDGVWAFRIRSTSEDYLANSKRLPSKTYINKTHGYILKDLLVSILPTSGLMTSAIFDTSHIMEGGTERIYQVDPTKVWSEIAAEFGTTDRFVYRVHNGHVFYVPESVFGGFTNDPRYRLVIDEDDPRFNPDRVEINRVSTQIVNDVTVVGEDEPGTICKEYFISDGYQPNHSLAFLPFGLDDSTVISDDFTGTAIDQSLWIEADTASDYITPFEGSLNITGGPGSFSSVHLRSRKGVELSGMIECRDGEIQFPPAPTGEAYLGGLFTSEDLALGNCAAGWYINLNGTAVIQPIGPTGIQAEAFYPTISQTRSYILRKQISVNQVYRESHAYQGPYPPGFLPAPPPGFEYEMPGANAVITWTIEEVNFDDPQAVVKTTHHVLKRLFTTYPEFAIYAPVVTKDAHLVINHVRVGKPQQIEVYVDGILTPGFVGNYVDGGRCQIVSENDRARLSWYAIDNGANGKSQSYFDEIHADSPTYYWRLGDPSGPAIDWTTRGNNGTLSGGVTREVAGAVAGDIDKAMRFNGSTGHITTVQVATWPATFSCDAWVKTSSSSALMPILSSETNTGVGVTFALSSGKVYARGTHIPAITGIRTINDGQWHHVMWTYDGTNSRFYVDGALDQTSAHAHTVGVNPIYIGAKTTATAAYFNGDLDEVAFYPSALTGGRALSHSRAARSVVADIVTIPPKGTKVEVKYRRRQKSMARVKNAASILAEAAKYRDDGVRQKILGPGDLVPVPRTSEESLLLAQAYLADNNEPRYEGKYSIETLEDNVTELRAWPNPGDMVLCKLDLPDGTEIDQYLTLENVNGEFLGKGCYAISMDFGPVNKLDKVRRELFLKRKSSSDEPSISDVETYEASDLNYSIDVRPDDPVDPTITGITSTTFSVSMGTGLPAGVAGYEVRNEDSGWGQPNYVAQHASTAFSLTRDRRDRLFYVRPYTAGGVYSRRSAMVRVVYPMANTTLVSGVDGTIAPDEINVFIGVPRFDKDFAGVVVQNSLGAIVYSGDGISHSLIMAGVTAFREADKINLVIPNPTAATTYAVSVSTYNLVGEFAAATGFNVSRQVPALTIDPAPMVDDPDMWSWDGTADGWQLTIFEDGSPIDSFTLPADVTSWAVGGGGRDRAVEVVPIDRWGGVTGGTGTNSGDTDVPSAVTISVTVMESPNGDGNQSFLLAWNAPASNARSLEHYILEVAPNNSFNNQDAGYAYWTVNYAQTKIFWNEPGVTRYFRVRGENSFGAATWSNVVYDTTGNVLDKLGPSGTWNYGAPTLSGSIIAAPGGHPLTTVDSGAWRGENGLDGLFRITRNILTTIKFTPDGSTEYTPIHNAMNVSSLANGSTVESGAVKAETNIQTGTGYYLGFLGSSARWYDGNVIAHAGLSLSSALYDGALMAGYATRASVGLDGSGNVARPLLSGIQIAGLYGGWFNIWRTGSTENDLDDINDGGSYFRTDGNRVNGAWYAFNALNSSSYLISGIYTSYSVFVGPDNLHTGAARAIGAIQIIGLDLYRIWDNMVDGMSVQEDAVCGASFNAAYRANNGFREGGSGFDRSA